MAKIKITKLKPNPDNPRKITKKKLEQLKSSIADFERMMELRPIIVDENWIILGGNMRYRALVELGYEEIDRKWYNQVKDLTDAEKQEFIAKDNIGYGEWDIDALQDGWDLNVLDAWGLSVDEKQKLEEGEVKFSTELDREQNYVVLRFDKDIDWLQAKTLLGLESKYSRRQNGKPWSCGIGRVIDGPEAIRKIKEA